MKVTFKVITSTYCLEYISSASVLKIIPEEEDLSALKDGVGGGQSQQRQGRRGAGQPELHNVPGEVPVQQGGAA